MNLISKLYNGELNPVENLAKQNGRYHAFLEKQSRSLDKFLCTLNSEQKALFEQYHENQTISNAHLLEQSFVKGFSIGAELILELKGR